MPPPLAKNKSFVMHGFGSRVEVIQIQLTHWAEFPDENSWVQNLTQAFKLHSFFAYPVTCEINSNSNSCMLCSYHLLPRGSTPGTPPGNPREPRGNGTVLVFLFSPQRRGVV